MEGWHLDRRVPITLIVTIIFQTCVFVWFLSGVDSRLSAVEKWQASNDATRERLAVLEVELRAIRASLLRIEHSLEK